MIKLGNKEYKYGLALAPMAGYTDRAMRLAAYKMGAEYTVTEMVSAKAVVFGDKINEFTFSRCFLSNSFKENNCNSIYSISSNFLLIWGG